MSKSRKIHLIYYREKTDGPAWTGWVTRCGENLWPHWCGSTQRDHATCKKCRKYIKSEEYPK